MTDFLLKQRTLDEVIQKTKVPTLDFHGERETAQQFDEHIRFGADEGNGAGTEAAL